MIIMLWDGITGVIANLTKYASDDVSGEENFTVFLKPDAAAHIYEFVGALVLWTPDGNNWHPTAVNMVEYYEDGDYYVVKCRVHDNNIVRPLLNWTEIIQNDNR